MVLGHPSMKSIQHHPRHDPTHSGEGSTLRSPARWPPRSSSAEIPAKNPPVVLRILWPKIPRKLRKLAMLARLRNHKGIKSTRQRFNTSVQFYKSLYRFARNPHGIHRKISQASTKQLVAAQKPLKNATARRLRRAFSLIDKVY